MCLVSLTKGLDGERGEASGEERALGAGGGKDDSLSLVRVLWDKQEKETNQLNQFLTFNRLAINNTHSQIIKKGWLVG